jgi:predicted trehalose synthase
VPFVDELSAWIIGQRWFAGKSHEPRLRVIDAQAAPGRATRYLVMDDAGARPTLYQVPIAMAAGDISDDLLLARDDAGRPVVDAAADRAFVLATLVAMGLDVSRVTGSRVLTGEQSNTSIVVEEDGAPTIIVKLFRILHHGENPDVTVQRALSQAGSPFVPRFLGSLEGEWPDAGRRPRVARGTTAFAQEFLPGVRDGWSIAVEAAREGRDFTEAAHDLGVAVAGVHAALADALPSRPGRSTDAAAAVAAWHRRLAIAAEEVPAIAERRAAIQAVYQTAFARRWPRLQRVHGDLHLGQVLAVPAGGWRLVDFEGEPLRPMRERALPDLPLRDVAGMLRSFEYASAVGAAPDPTEWARACREAFLGAYTANAPGPALDEGLLRALQLDKAVYEAIYEARNRPDWLAIPLAGVDAALG